MGKEVFNKIKKRRELENLERIPLDRACYAMTQPKTFGTGHESAVFQKYWQHKVADFGNTSNVNFFKKAKAGDELGFNVYQEEEAAATEKRRKKQEKLLQKQEKSFEKGEAKEQKEVIKWRKKNPEVYEKQLQDLVKGDYDESRFMARLNKLVPENETGLRKKVMQAYKGRNRRTRNKGVMQTALEGNIAEAVKQIETSGKFRKKKNAPPNYTGLKILLNLAKKTKRTRPIYDQVIQQYIKPITLGIQEVLNRDEIFMDWKPTDFFKFQQDLLIGDVDLGEKGAYLHTEDYNIVLACYNKLCEQRFGKYIDTTEISPQTLAQHLNVRGVFSEDLKIDQLGNSLDPKYTKAYLKTILGHVSEDYIERTWKDILVFI